MYVCQICRAVAPPRQPMRRHVISRTVPAKVEEGWDRDRRERYQIVHPERLEIATELAVCQECYDLLSGGVPLAVVRRQRPAPLPLPLPPPLPLPEKPAVNPRVVVDLNDPAYLGDDITVE